MFGFTAFMGLLSFCQAPVEVRFEKEIAQFEAQDRKNPVKPGGILFVGSSSIRLWKLKDSFPELDALNRGFGGSHLSDVVTHADRIVLAYKPKTIVLYGGDNDLASKKTPETVRDDYRKLIEKVRKALPETKIIFIAIKPSPKRATQMEMSAKANTLIREVMKGDDKQIYLDVWPRMLGSDGQPKAELFVTDMLHMNEKGYEIWAELLKPMLK